MKDQQDIKILFQKYINQTINAKELHLLHLLAQDQTKQKQLDELLEQHFASDITNEEYDGKTAQYVKETAWLSVQKHLNQPTVLKPWYKQNSFKLISAAAVILLVSATIILLNNNSSVSKTNLSVRKNINDINPGSNRATLTSSNGKVYNLSGEKGEIIADQNSIHYKDGIVLADDASNNTVILSTPRGGQYKAILSDGTKVWLNASSSLKYPTSFTGNQRKVELTGEAYFEVTHNPSQAFVVVTKHQEVKVLGTSFNVNAYPDDNKTVTTLLAGRVQLNTNNVLQAKQLLPGQQAILNGADFNIENVDAAIFAAWKDGEFRFKATSLVDVLKQIERWYDLDIDYSNIPNDVYIHASINRNRKLSIVLDALEKITDLKFEIKGRSVKLMH